MVAEPAATPVTTPVTEPMEPIAVLLLLQVPPPVTSIIVDVAPWHSAVAPVIAEGDELTVTVAVT